MGEQRLNKQNTLYDSRTALYVSYWKQKCCLCRFYFILKNTPLYED